jgi:hypothetical protein
VTHVTTVLTRVDADNLNLSLVAIVKVRTPGRDQAVLQAGRAPDWVPLFPAITYSACRR